MRLPSGLSYRSNPSAWTASCHSAKRTSALLSARLSIIITMNGRTKVWATSRHTQDNVDGNRPGAVP